MLRTSCPKVTHGIAVLADAHSLRREGVSGAPGQTRTDVPLLRRYATQNSSVSNWTEAGLKLVGCTPKTAQIIPCSDWETTGRRWDSINCYRSEYSGESYNFPCQIVAMMRIKDSSDNPGNRPLTDGVAHNDERQQPA